MANKHGSCHCGAVRFEVEVDLSSGVTQCNCTICTKTATIGSIVKPSAFTLLSGEDALSYYEWGGKTARRFFCKHCGIHCFARGYLAQVGGDYVAIAVNCLDDVDLTTVKVMHWDGRHDNWSAGARDTRWPSSAAS